MKKRFISLLLCLLLCLSLAPVGALAEEESHEHTDDCGHDAAVTLAFDGEGETGEPGDPVGGTVRDCEKEGHDWNAETGACSVCGKLCDHSGNTNPLSCTSATACSVCGKAEALAAAHD